MNDIILDFEELKNIMRYFGKDIIEGMEHKRRKEPLKDNLNCSNSELLEHIEETREKRCNTRIIICWAFLMLIFRKLLENVGKKYIYLDKLLNSRR